MDLKIFTTWPETLTLANSTRLLCLWLLYRLLLALYNISPFHPLYQFPGPRLAAMSFLYEAWFDFILKGRYSMEIKRLHEIYGPVIRINPEELHCNDPDFYDEIYAAGGRVRDKQLHYLGTTAGPLTVSSFASVDHETHRMRRGAMNRFFSKAQMLKLEPEVHLLAQQVCDKMLSRSAAVGGGSDEHEQQHQQQPIDMIQVYNCFTADTISQYAYGQPLGFVGREEGWDVNFKDAFDAFTSTSYLFRFVPPARRLIHLAPYLARYMPGEVRLLMREMTEVIPGHIERALKDRSRGRIFSDLLDSSLPEPEKAIYRLAGEGFSLMAAGSETTASALTAITYHLLDKPELLRRLRSELAGVDAHALSWTALEQNAYLWAVINEGLRLTYGISGRTPRIARNEDLVYRKAAAAEDRSYHYRVPRGTPIGMSAVIQHHNEEVFPDSRAFLPDRWLDGSGRKNHALEKYLVSFNRGSRQCLGMNLALCELNLLTAAMALRVLPRARLYETGIADVEYDYDNVTYQTRDDSKGVRVVMAQ
ncbi:putative cytochrome P450 [Xylariomycetidae sp. FL2044]|nr:putative cytochrome P450 [Xylariomycetidae sp. FL2044]